MKVGRVQSVSEWFGVWVRFVSRLKFLPRLVVDFPCFERSCCFSQQRFLVFYFSKHTDVLKFNLIWIHGCQENFHQLYLKFHESFSTYPLLIKRVNRVASDDIQSSCIE